MTSAPSLRRRMIGAGAWSLSQAMIGHVLRLISNLIMTRFLVPEAFGLIAMAATVITAFSLLSDIGIQKSVVREPDGEDAHFLRVAWVVKILRGVVVALGTCVAAVLLGVLGPALAREGTVYADPRLPWLIALTALVPLLQGAEATTRELAQRRLKLGYFTGLSLAAQVISTLTMIAFATISPTVWALMAGMLMGPLVTCLASFVVYPGPSMRPVWDREIADRLWQYGKWLMGSSAFTFVAQNGDRFILGALLNATSFGLYVIARVWIDAGRQVIGRLNGQVGFAGIGEVLRHRPEAVPRLFRKYQTVIDALCLLAFLTLFFFGQEMIRLLYTPAYAEAGTHLQVLSLTLLVVRFNTLSGLIMNIGNSRAAMLISAGRAVTLCIALPLAYRAFGLTGALFAVALSPLAVVPYMLWLLRGVLGRQLLIDLAWLVALLAFGIGFGAVVT